MDEVGVSSISGVVVRRTPCHLRERINVPKSFIDSTMLRKVSMDSAFSLILIQGFSITPRIPVRHLIAASALSYGF